MLLSYQWLSELVDLSSLEGPDQLADVLNQLGLEVESVHSLSKGFEKVITAQIVSKEQHPNADRLSVCQVISKEKGEAQQIVCGATNMKAGDKVAMAQVGAALPIGLTIKASKIRGVESNGMLCSEEELGLGQDSQGIIILPPETKLGRPYAEVLERNDTLLELSITPNRGDCLSHYGVAREIGAFLGKKPKLPKLKPLEYKNCPIKTDTKVAADGPQFWGAYIEGVKVGPSPAWLKNRLEALGSRSINNVVDASNWVLFELGQPNHAYDADKLSGKKLTIEMAQKGHDLLLLDDGKIKLTGDELVIADDKNPVALAGVMGGGDSQVTESTQNIFLEVAEFSPVLVRRAAKRFQRHSDASQRFERGIDPNGQDYALNRLARLIVEVAGGKIKGATATAKAGRNTKGELINREIALNPSYFEQLLGLEVANNQASKILKSLGCEVNQKGSVWTVTVPGYRWDLNIKEDLVEEVGRFVGYDKIPATVPPLSDQPALSGTGLQDHFDQVERAKDVLLDLGLSETVNYSFTSKKWLEEFGLSSEIAVQNPLSEDHEVMTPSLLPGLIKNVIDNKRHHFGSDSLGVRLFELRPTFQLGKGGKVAAASESDTGVEEKWKLSFVLSGPQYTWSLKSDQRLLDFYDVKGIVEKMFQALGTKGARLREAPADSTMVHPGQAATVFVGKGPIGYFGMLHPKLQKKFKLKDPVWVGELDWGHLSSMSLSANDVRKFKTWSEYPTMERDFAFLVKDTVTADQISQTVLRCGKPLVKVAKIFDVYRGSQVGEGMTSVAVRVIFSDEARSLEEAEVDQVSSKILDQLKTKLGAELRS